MRDLSWEVLQSIPSTSDQAQAGILSRRAPMALGVGMLPVGWSLFGAPAEVYLWTVFLGETLV